MRNIEKMGHFWDTFWPDYNGLYISQDNSGTQYIHNTSFVMIFRKFQWLLNRLNDFLNLKGLIPYNFTNITKSWICDLSWISGPLRSKDPVPENPIFYPTCLEDIITAKKGIQFHKELTKKWSLFTIFFQILRVLNKNINFAPLLRRPQKGQKNQF